MSLEKYLRSTANDDDFSSSAEISEIIRLAKLDLQQGILIAQLFYWCCQYCPKRKFLQKLIELGKKTETERFPLGSAFLVLLVTQTEKGLAKRVFKFKTQAGSNCLIGLFQMANS